MEDYAQRAYKMGKAAKEDEVGKGCGMWLERLWDGAVWGVRLRLSGRHAER